MLQLNLFGGYEYISEKPKPPKPKKDVNSMILDYNNRMARHYAKKFAKNPDKPREYY